MFESDAFHTPNPPEIQPPPHHNEILDTPLQCRPVVITWISKTAQMSVGLDQEKILPINWGIYENVFLKNV